jgi:hypothetical protein
VFFVVFASATAVLLGAYEQIGTHFIQREDEDQLVDGLTRKPEFDAGPDWCEGTMPSEVRLLTGRHHRAGCGRYDWASQRKGEP